MRKLFKSIILAFLTIPAMAQIPAPQINLGGNIGCQGFPCLNNGTLQFTGDADRNMTVQETSATGGIKVTSTVPLTATRNLILPVGNFQFIAVENATTGGQSIQVIGQSGTGVTIANGASATVWFDGTNVVQTGSSSSSGEVIATPQYRVFLQPNSGTAAVAEGAVVGQNAVAPMAQGTINSDLYATGSGNNGVANALASTACATAGCTLQRPITTTDSEYFSSILNSTSAYLHGIDNTAGVNHHYFNNVGASNAGQNANLYNCYWNQISTVSPSQNAGYGCDVHYTTVSSGGIYVGSPWTEIHSDEATDNYYTRSIGQAHSTVLNAYSIGDKAAYYAYINARPGSIATNDEGVEGEVIEFQESGVPYNGTLTMGGANATLVNATWASAGGNVGDGMNLIDASQVMASGLMVSTAAGGGVLPQVLTTSDTHPTNNAYALLSGTCGVNVERDQPVSQTCNITSYTGTFSAAAGATVCVGDPAYFEQAAITGITSSTITIKLAYKHQSGVAIEQGPMCGGKIAMGYGLTDPTNGGNFTSYPVVGSTSANTLDYVVMFKGGQQGYAQLVIPTLPTQSLGTLTRSGNVVTTSLPGSTAVIYNNFVAPGTSAITISGASDSSFNGAISGITTTPTSISWPQTGANGTATGATLSLVGYNNYTVYCGAETVKVDGVSFIGGNDTPSVAGPLQLEANNCNWNIGDRLMQPNFYAQNVSGIHYDSNGFTAPTGNPDSGIDVSLSGQKNTGAYDFDITNPDNLNSYVGFGGIRIPHVIMQAQEYYNIFFNGFYAPMPGGQLITLGCPPGGCNSNNFTYSLFALSSVAGERYMSFNPVTGVFGFNSSQLAVNGSLVCTANGTNCPTASPAAAGTLTGTTLNSTVTASSLTSLGTVSSLAATKIAGSGTATFSLGSASVVGTGATTPTCTTVCDSISGTVGFTTGTGATGAGIALTVTLPISRGAVNCVAQNNIIGATSIATFCSGSGNTISISSSALPASVPVTFTYAVFGQ